MTKPSSRIQTFTVCTPTVPTVTVASGPSIVLRDQVHDVPKPKMRSALVRAVPSRPA